MHAASMHDTPPIAETVGVIAVHVKPFTGAVLQHGDGVVATFEQEFYGLGAELAGVESIKQDGPTTTLGVANFSSEDRFAGGIAPAVKLKVTVANKVNELVAQCLGCTA